MDLGVFRRNPIRDTFTRGHSKGTEIKTSRTRLDGALRVTPCPMHPRPASWCKRSPAPGRCLSYVKLLLRRSLPLWLILTRSAVAMALVAHHLLVLLLLIGIQDRLDLVRRLLPDLLHLAHAVLL